MTPLLEITDVDVAYGPIQILFGVTMNVGAGEAVGLLGTNGAGKSTLLRAISGLEPVASGTIAFEGEDITQSSTSTRVARGIVQVAGGSAVFANMSVRENLQVGAFRFLQDDARVAARTEAVLELFPELQKLLGQPAGTLSGGEQQMVGLAKALLPEPRLLIVDELSLGLAPLIVQRLLEVIARLHAEGVSMLIVEQSLNVAAAFADRVVFLERGDVGFDGPPADLMANESLARAVFLGVEA